MCVLSILCVDSSGALAIASSNTSTEPVRSPNAHFIDARSRAIDAESWSMLRASSSQSSPSLYFPVLKRIKPRTCSASARRGAMSTALLAHTRAAAYFCSSPLAKRAAASSIQNSG